MKFDAIGKFSANIPQNPLFLQKPKNETPKIEGETFEKSGAPDENSSLIINKMQAKDIGEKTEAEKPREFPFTPQWENKSNPDGTKEVTVLFYMNGQTDLAPDCHEGLLQLELVDNSEDVNIIAQFGKISELFGEDSPKWVGARRYKIQNKEHASSDIFQKYLDTEKKIPKNPILKHMIGENYWHQGERELAKKYLNESIDLGFLEFIKDPKSEKNQQIIDEVNKYTEDTIQNFNEDYKIKSDVIEKLPRFTSMSDAKVLEDFVQWGMKKYPAKHYMLVIQNHGEAWHGSVDNPRLMAKAIENGIAKVNKETGKNDHIDALIFNSCYMGNAEAINEMKNCADITVASENYSVSNIFTDWNHFINKIEKNIGEGKSFDGKEFASEMVDYYREEAKYIKDNLKIFATRLESYSTLTAVDNKKMGDLAESWKKFNQACKKEGVTDQQLFAAVNNAKNYSSEDQIRDMGGIMDEIKKIDVPDSVKKAADGVKEALKSVIINEQHEGSGMEGSSGLTVWGPVDYESVDYLSDNYEKFVPDFAINSGWMDRLKEASSHIPIEVKKSFSNKDSMEHALIKLSDMQTISEPAKKNLQNIGILTKEEQKRFTELLRKDRQDLNDLKDTNLPPKEKQMVDTFLSMKEDDKIKLRLGLTIMGKEKEFVKNSLGLSDQEANNLHTLTSFTQEQKVKFDKATEDLKKLGEMGKLYADRS